jgi:hypothetical protein
MKHRYIILFAFFLSLCGIHVANAQEKINYEWDRKILEDRNMMVTYKQFATGNYAVVMNTTKNAPVPSNLNYDVFPFSGKLGELEYVAKDILVKLLVEYYPQICDMLEEEKIVDAVFHLRFYEQKEMLNKDFDFFTSVKSRSQVDYLHAFEKLVTSDDRIREMVGKAADVIYEQVPVAVPLSMQSAEHIEKNKKGEYGYEYFDYLYVIITRNDLLNYVVDNLSFNSQEHTEGCSLSITEKENPISNSKIKKLPFNRKDKKFQQSCKEAFMQSLEEDYPAILKLLKTGKLSEVKLTVNLDDKGDLINKGFNFYTATKFMALTKDFSKKFRRSTLLRQIVNKTCKRIYERCPIENPRETLSEDILQKVKAGEKGYGYYTKMEIRITEDDLKK